MFDLENHELIMKLINLKKPGEYLMPLYVRIYNDRYTLPELKDIRNFNPSAFKIGYGARVSMFDKCSFPKTMMFTLEPVTAFSNFNIDKNTDEKFLVFEFGMIDKSVMLPDQKNQSYQIIYTVLSQAESYQTILLEYLSKQQETIRRQLIQEMMNE